VPRVMRLSAPVLFAAGLLAAPAAGGTNAAPKITIKVTATEFKFKLSRTTVPKGAVVTFKVVNKGKAVHDFDFVSPRKGTKYLAPGKKASFALRFRKKGSYRFVCTVPRHAQLGMAGKLRVK
jgi:uncharacterized cupredoxin-like copper-binding protein